MSSIRCHFSDTDGILLELFEIKPSKSPKKGNVTSKIKEGWRIPCDFMSGYGLNYSWQKYIPRTVIIMYITAKF